MKVYDGNPNLFQQRPKRTSVHAYADGAAAQRAGTAAEGNPFNQAWDEHRAWAAGWQDAAADTLHPSVVVPPLP